ncbi:DUF3892 domain-containing protein [Hyphomonas sp.]|uniref:DUF3892 domain-containing protein n=1 Tax=Hyphomonas sp. TaxID=87 RepID=UPI003FA5F381
MGEYQITHIRLDGPDADRRIDLLKGPEFGPSSVDDVVTWMKAGHKFWVAGNPSAWLEDKTSSADRPYVRTVPDGKYDNNLYALPKI